jgi:hypothetical protein
MTAAPSKAVSQQPQSKRQQCAGCSPSTALTSAQQSSLGRGSPSVGELTLTATSGHPPPTKPVVRPVPDQRGTRSLAGSQHRHHHTSTGLAQLGAQRVLALPRGSCHQTLEMHGHVQHRLVDRQGFAQVFIACHHPSSKVTRVGSAACRLCGPRARPLARQSQPSGLTLSRRGPR